ncbi:cytochrome C assembly family protein [Hypericibacter sp.]|uniref:cytochrome C assembly family protein n=1 Tax=Hypericibacter sp. TaxID=2705401 RepID=UPI003D6D4647
MTNGYLLSLAAAVALLPVTLLVWRRPGAAAASFWVLLAVAIAGACTVLAVHQGHGWTPGLSQALWATIAACLLIFALLGALVRESLRLSILLLPYLLLLGLLATCVAGLPSAPLSAGAATAWLDLHILISVSTYGLVTLAAVASLALFLQERALKAKRPTAITRALPSMTDCETLEVRLMAIGLFVLGVGLLTGMATEYMEAHRLLILDHKTVFSLLAFLVIGILLLLHRVSGLRGRRAARIALLAYLLLTLAYPGVKVVTQIILA